MKLIKSFVTICLLIWSFNCQAIIKPEFLMINIGQSEVLSYENVTRVSIGDGKLIKVEVLRDSGQILVIGLARGTTDLRIWSKKSHIKHFRIRVQKDIPDNIYPKVKQQLSDIDGIQIREIDGDVVIEGSGLSENDMQRINTLRLIYPNIKAYVSESAVQLSNMIHMDVKVVEIKKSDLKNIGINWGNVINGPEYAFAGDFNTNAVYRPTSELLANSTIASNSIGSSNPYFGITTHIKSVINLLSRDGHARLLAEPKLSCRSGGKAEFLAGGEIPLPVQSSDGSSSVTFKQYGIILKMEPVADSKGNVSTHISVEVSTVDDSIKVKDIPGFLTRKTETDMNVQQGETMVISGLLNTEISKNVERLPGLGNIPILGELFKSRSFRNNETELIVLVTPSIVNPAHKLVKERIQRAQHIIKQGNEAVKFKLLD